MADVTRRFRAGTTIPYVQALITLTGYARTHDADFAYGPAGNVGAVMDNGLTVSGPEAVVEILTDVLGREVPGLYQVEELAQKRRAGWR